MNTHTTNPRKITFASKEKYLEFIKLWKSLASSKEASNRDHMIYALLVGKPLDQMFTPVTTAKKLETQCNGDKYHFIKSLMLYYGTSIFRSDAKYYYGIWKEVLTPEIVQQVNTVLAFYKDHEEFIKGNYSVAEAIQKSTPVVITPVKIVTRIANAIAGE